MKRYRGSNSTFYKGFIMLALGLFFAFIGIHAILTKSSIKPAFLRNSIINNGTSGSGTGQMEGISVFLVIMLLVCAFFFILLGVYIVVDFLTGFERARKRFLKNNPAPETEAKVRSFLSQTKEEVIGMMINEEFIFLHSGGLNYYLDYSANIVSASNEIKTDRNEYGKELKTTKVHITFVKHEYTLHLPNEACCEKVQHYIRRHCPHLDTERVPNSVEFPS